MSGYISEKAVRNKIQHQSLLKDRVRDMSLFADNPAFGAFGMGLMDFY